jgi:hypothetical protein
MITGNAHVLAYDPLVSIATNTLASLDHCGWCAHHLLALFSIFFSAIAIILFRPFLIDCPLPMVCIVPASTCPCYW